jgi:hypothetical protein
MNFFLIIFIFLISCERSQDAAYVKQVDYKTSDVPYHLSHKTELKKFPVVLFLNSASCRNTASLHSGALFSFEKADIGILTIDKAGTRTGFAAFYNLFFCSEIFWQKNFPSARTNDILNVLNDLTAKDSGWDGSLYIVGAFEGALSAIEVAKGWPNTKGLILLSIGSGLKDSTVFKNALACLNKNSSSCTSVETSIKEKLTEIYSEPENSIRTWSIEGFSGTAKWYKEMLAFDLHKSLDFKIPPTLIIHGAKDYIVPSSTLDHTGQINANITVKIFSELDQGWMDSNNKSRSHDIEAFTRDWILDKLKQKL